jgi:hypothetical protein
MSKTPLRCDDLETYVCHLLDTDPVVRRLTRDILRTQKRLRVAMAKPGFARQSRNAGRYEKPLRVSISAGVDGKAWLTYLRLEALVNHRHDEILQRVWGNLARGPRQ